MARDLAAIAAGGQASTGPVPLRSAEHTQVFDRATLSTPTVLPAVGKRSRRRTVLIAGSALTVLVVAVVALLLPRAADPTGPPVKVDAGVPTQLRNDVQRLQNEVVK